MDSNHRQNELASAWEQFFDKESSHYLEHGFTTNTIREVAFLLDELQLEIGKSILDIGCGAGLTHYESTRSVVKSAVMYPIVAMDRNARNGNEYITSLW